MGHLVRFGLPLPAPQLAHAFRDADLVAVPSYSESFGLVAIEAQACGTPVLAHRVGGLPYAVKEGYSGVLVPGLEPEDWAAAMIDLAEEPEARQRLGRQAALHAGTLVGKTRPLRPPSRMIWPWTAATESRAAVSFGLVRTAHRYC